MLWSLQIGRVQISEGLSLLVIVFVIVLVIVFVIIYFQICDELNSPTLPNVEKWSGHRGTWKCVVSEATGRMYKVSIELECRFFVKRYPKSP